MENEKEPPTAVCSVDGEPLISTFRYPGAEFVCLVCGKRYGYRVGWKANIAMAFVDEMSRYRMASGKTTVPRRVIHQIANTAAENFLTALEAK